MIALYILFRVSKSFKSAWRTIYFMFLKCIIYHGRHVGKCSQAISNHHPATIMVTFFFCSEVRSSGDIPPLVFLFFSFSANCGVGHYCHSDLSLTSPLFTPDIFMSSSNLSNLIFFRLPLLLSSTFISLTASKSPLPNK